MNPAALYRQVMGPAFDELDEPVRRFHSLAGRHELKGSVEIDAPEGRIARGIAFLTGTPLHEVRGDLRFELDAGESRETWTRHFPGKSMSSMLALRDGLLVEQLGPACMTFHLGHAQGRLSMHLVRMTFMGVPCPGWLRPRVVAEEWGEGDRMRFRIEARLPVVGKITGYRGYVEPPDQPARLPG